MGKRIPIIVCLVLMLIIIGIVVRGRLDTMLYDMQLRYQIAWQQPAINPAIVIVDIDDQSIQQIGRWPWPRSKMATLVNKLREQGASVIALDIFFSEPQQNIAREVLTKINQVGGKNAAFSRRIRKYQYLFNEDGMFAKSLGRVKSVLAVTLLTQTTETINVLPNPMLVLALVQSQQLFILKATGYFGNVPVLQRAAKLAGFVNIIPDRDGIFRHVPVMMQYKQGLYPSLAVQAVMRYLNLEPVLLTRLEGDQEKLSGLQLGEKQVETDQHGVIRIPFVGKSHTFPYISAADILSGRVPRERIQGKLVFIGITAIGLGEYKATPVDKLFPGVEIQASVANALLQQSDTAH